MRILTAALWLAPSLALAQAETPAELLGPADPRLQAPLTYRPAFEALPTMDDAIDWRRANDEAGRLRGHMGQIRDAGEPASAAKPVIPDPKPRTHGHGTH